MQHGFGWVAVVLALAVVTLAGIAPAAAETRRIVIAVGHNTGGDERAPLRFAEEDAGKFADVMVDLGDVAPSDVFLLQGKGSAAVLGALDQAAAAVTRARANPDDRVVLIFFYSGHSDGQSIELARERLSYSELRAALAKTGADVRIAIVDSCKSGALIKEKGGARGPAFSIHMIDDLRASGEVFLTSAAADEDALESAEVRGSFFTHHLVSGLRGAADTSGDGAVTLSEAYEYAFNHTVASTAQTGAPPQHPTYDYRVAGRGELRLTELTRRSAVIEIASDFQRALITQPRRDQVIAELTAAATRRIAVAPGDYSVRLWSGNEQRFGRITVGAGQTVSVTWNELTPRDAPPAAPARKGGRSEAPTAVEPALPPVQQAEWDRLSLTVDSSDQLFQGRLQHRIDQGTAFDLMHRMDLVAAYHHQQTIKTAMIASGIAIAVGALIVDRLVVDDCATRIPFGVPGTATSFDICQSNADTVNPIAAIIGIGGGVLAVVGALRSPDVVTGNELHALVDDHNRTLRTRLLNGEPAPAAAPPPPPRAPAATIRLSPWLRRGDRASGGLAVIGRF